MKRLQILLVGMLVLLLAACGGADNSGKSCVDVEIAGSGMPDLGGCTLRVATENNYPPFSLIDMESGEPVGYDYDVFNEICGLLNCTPEFIETSWDAIVAMMAGESDFSAFDVGADGITITDERAQFVDFSDPYINSQQVMLVRADESRFAEPSELAADASLLVGSQPGTTNYDTSVELVGEERIVGFDQFGTAVQSLIQGDVDAVIIDNVSGQGYVGANPDSVKLSGEPLTSESLGFIFSQGSPLRGAVNSALAELNDNGKMDELYDVWFLTE